MPVIVAIHGPEARGSSSKPTWVAEQVHCQPGVLGNCLKCK